LAGSGFFESIARDLSGHGLFGGKFQVRLVLQPLAAILFGLKFGVRDAKAGKPPFFMALATSQGERGQIIKGAARDAIIPLCLALLLDSILQHMINGRIRPLAVTTKTRAKDMPEVPTMTESGYPDFLATYWNGVLAPEGTPRAIVEQLNAAINASLATTETRAAVLKLGMTPIIASPQEFAARIARELAQWTAVAKAAHISID